MKVAILNGPARSGKDTFMLSASRILGCRTGFISTIDKVKQAFYILGWDGSKGEKERKFLSDLKDMWTDYNDGPVKEVIKYIKYVEGKGDYLDILFVICREPSEIARLVNEISNMKIPVTTIHIDRDVKRFNNHADSGTREYRYDHYIDNNGTIEELEAKVKKVFS